MTAPEGQAAAEALVAAARTARFYRPEIVLDLIDPATVPDGAAAERAVRDLRSRSPELARFFDSGAGAGQGADAVPTVVHPDAMNSMIRRHYWSG